MNYICNGEVNWEKNIGKFNIDNFSYFYCLR